MEIKFLQNSYIEEKKIFPAFFISGKEILIQKNRNLKMYVPLIQLNVHFLVSVKKVIYSRLKIL